MWTITKVATTKSSTTSPALRVIFVESDGVTTEHRPKQKLISHARLAKQYLEHFFSEFEIDRARLPRIRSIFY